MLPNLRLALCGSGITSHFASPDELSNLTQSQGNPALPEVCSLLPVPSAVLFSETISPSKELTKVVILPIGCPTGLS